MVESEEQILPATAGGAAEATHGQHKVWFPQDIYNGVITMTMPNGGKHLKSRVLGLSYSDGINSVLIALTTNSIGQILLSGNQVIYTDAFASTVEG